MKKIYIKPACRLIVLQTSSMMSVSSLGLKKSETEADPDSEVLSREQQEEGGVWKGMW